MSNPEIMWSKAFAWNATNKNTIQEQRQPSQGVQDATLNDGFPLITMTPQDAGGIAPNGQDMNGALYAISSDMVHRQKGLRIQFDPTYAAKIGGYDQGCILASNDYTRDYISLIPNNLTDPNGSGTAGRWAIYSGAGSIASATASIAGIVKIVDNLSSTATDAALTANQGKVLSDILDIIAYSPIPYFGNSAPSGFLAMNGQAITSAQYPKLFARYGSTLPNLNDGSFIRGVGGDSAGLGVKQGDAIRNITGTFSGYTSGNTASRTSGAFTCNYATLQGPKEIDNIAEGGNTTTFDASLVVPTANENRPKNMAFLYIVKAG